MRRKSERTASKKAKASPEKKVDKVKRTRTRRKKHSTSSENESAEETSTVQVVEAVVEPEQKPPTTPVKETSPEEAQEVWHVKAAEGSGDMGEIKKIKICLTRPPSTPERVDRSPRSKRKHSRATSSSDTPSVEGVEEKRKSKHRSKRLARESKDELDKSHDSQGDDSETAGAENPDNEITQSGNVDQESVSDETPMSTTGEEVKDFGNDKSTVASEKAETKESNVSTEGETQNMSPDADTTVASHKTETQESESEANVPVDKRSLETETNESVDKSEVLELHAEESKDDTDGSLHMKADKEDAKMEEQDTTREEERTAASSDNKVSISDSKNDQSISEETESICTDSVKPINETNVVESSEIVENEKTSISDSDKQKQTHKDSHEEIMKTALPDSNQCTATTTSSDSCKDKTKNSSDSNNEQIQKASSDSDKDKNDVSNETQQKQQKQMGRKTSSETEEEQSRKYSTDSEKLKHGDLHVINKGKDKKDSVDSNIEKDIDNNKSNEKYKIKETVQSDSVQSTQDESIPNGQTAPIVINRKRKWGSRPKITTQKSITISTDVLKDIIPDVKPVEFDEVIEEKKIHKRVETSEKIERPVLPKIVIDNTENVEQHRKENEVKEKETVKGKESLSMNRRISIVKDSETIIARPPSPPRHKQSNILYITNLVRPFTLPQLKNLLQRTGRIAENGFWIDRIKSKCFVQYETEDQAVETRHALHGVTWPVSNPKTLQVDFSTQEAFDKAKINEDNDNAQASSIPGTVEDWLREQDMKRERGEQVDKPWERKAAMREWDVGKNEKEKDKDKLRRDDRPVEKRRHRTPERSPEPARKFKKKEEEAPAKLLDDLFRKTKTTPCIYWLPLSAETIAIKEEQRRQHMAEHERRMQELRRTQHRRH